MSAYSWKNEWKQYLTERAAEHENTMALHPDYTSLKNECFQIGIVCTPEIFNEYKSLNIVPRNNSIKSFIKQSQYVQGQLMEYVSIHNMEMYSKQNKYTFYDLSILERVSLASHFVGQRSGG